MTRRIIDLTFPIHEGMATFPSHWHPVVEITQLGRHGIENRETRKMVLGSHTGTHCDAPRHFVPGGQTIDELLLEVLIGPATVVDFSDCQPGQEIGSAELEGKLGNRTPERLLLRYNWSRHWGKMAYYQDYPFISQDAARWLIRRGVKLVGMDTPSPDNPKHSQGTALDSPVHKVLLENGVILLEYLCNFKELQRPEVELIALPLKISGGDGAPARCVAIEK